MVGKVVAYIELDPETIINNVKDRYNIPINDITMDDIFEYVNDGMSYLENKQHKGINMVADGWSLDGFDPSTYKEIQEVLENMQDE